MPRRNASAEASTCASEEEIQPRACRPDSAAARVLGIVAGSVAHGYRIRTAADATGETARQSVEVTEQESSELVR